MTYRLLNRFQAIFDGARYRHRVSTNGDWVAVELFEDLRTLARSAKLVSRIDAGESVINLQNTHVGIKRRRGDGSFGEIVPNITAVPALNYTVPRGPIATLEIGVEAKIFSKAMNKQLDRVEGDLEKQARLFRSRGSDAICVA